MKNIVLGQYVPGDSYLYKLDPRTKIIALLLIMASVFLLKSITQVLIGLGVIVLIFISGKISLIRIMKGLRPLIVLMMFTFVFQVLFNDTGEILYSTPVYFGWLSIGLVVVWTCLYLFTKKYVKFKLLMMLAYLGGVFLIFKYVNVWTFSTSEFTIPKEGLNTAIFVILRLIIVIALATILTITTKPTDLNLGIEKLLAPLKVIKLKPEEYALIISISLRYIPTIMDEASKIMQAQASRGSDFKEGNLKDKIGQIVSLLVPMFIIAFQRSDELANAMEARNFIPGEKRTKLYELKWRWKDTITLSVTLLLLGVVIWLRVM